MHPAPFDLNLRHLRALSAIVARGSMSAAADAVNLSQPALTQGLRKLEDQVGVPLLNRRSDGTAATADGLLLEVRARAAFAQLGAAMRGRVRGFAQPDRLATATQLHALVALADAGGFAGAAVATGVSQPALHRAVRDLEQVCGVAITNRRGRGTALTAAGRRIARGARLAAAELAAGIAEISSDPDDVGRIAIGAMPLCRALVLPRALAAFTRGVPRATVDVREGSWRELVEPLSDGSIDLMIGALRPELLPGLDQRTLFDDRLAIVGRAGHPLALERAPDRAALARYGWIIGQAGTPLRAQWEALFANGGRPPAPIECGSVMVIRGVLSDSDLLTLLAPDQVALEIASGVLTVIGAPLAGGMRTIGVTTRAGWRPTPAQARLLRLIDEAAVATRVPEIR